MKTPPPLSLLALLALIAGCTEPTTTSTTVTTGTDTVADEKPSDISASPAKDEPKVQLTDGIYLVDDYDPQRDVAADMESAISAAGQLNKRILLEVGGQW